MVKKLYVIAVAPHTGAWIETSFDTSKTIANLVAPHTGAWIETLYDRFPAAWYSVAPHTGAWIETPESLRIP